MKDNWIHNQKDFQRARTDILAVAVAERLEILNRGVKAMDVDSLGENLKTTGAEEQDSWTTKEWLEWTQEEEQIDYMGKSKGKSRGKGKRGKGGFPWTSSGKDSAEGKGGK